MRTRRQRMGETEENGMMGGAVLMASTNTFSSIACGIQVFFKTFHLLQQSSSKRVNLLELSGYWFSLVISHGSFN